MAQNDVLIIGAGPSGLFVAAELARFGVTARLIERDLEPHREARATSIQPGTLEILNSVGLLQPFVDCSEHIHCARMYGPAMTELGSMSHDGIGCCCEFQCSLPQYETQRILEEHLVSLGGHVERGVTATKVDAEGDELVVELTHADGKIEAFRPSVIIGAGGAHSVTRHSMGQPLEGETYHGNFLVADIAMPAPIPRDEAGVICGPDGLLLLAPLPGGRWISFQDLEDDVERVTADDVVARIERRLAGRFQPTEVSWFSPFRMHQRMVARLADGRRFLIGDAAHLSSPFGGEGLNAGLHDGHDLAWKLALVLRGHAQRSLLEAYAFERRTADRHVLKISDQVHCSVVDAVIAARERREIHPQVVDPIAAALIRNARAMIDVDYAGSPLVLDHAAGAGGPSPGQWYPDWSRFGGAMHCALIFGTIADTELLGGFDRRWAHLVHVSQNPDVDPSRAGVASGGVIMVRPDGHIGFRAASVSADAFKALDRHLCSYLTPNKNAAPV